MNVPGSNFYFEIIPTLPTIRFQFFFLKNLLNGKFS